MDALTGLALVVFPKQVVQAFGVAVPSADALVYLSWIGAFVGGVGLSYGLALGERRRGRAVWQVTALVRALVAVFVISRIVGGALVSVWLVVALTDLVAAVVQIAVLRAGWWEEVRR